jgi:F-type H+-transporting ATPase subunit gamma
MALGLRDIKRRIRSVKNTQKICKAMEMVAAARLKRAQTRLAVARSYLNYIEDIKEKVIKSLPKNFKHPFLSSTKNKKPKTKNYALIIISSDRGLCGAYNSNLFRYVLEFLKNGEPKILFLIGRKAYNFFKRSEYKIKYCELPLRPRYEDLKNFADDVIKYYNEYKISELYIIYTKFISTTRHQVMDERILPGDEATSYQLPATSNIIFEPKPEKILNELITHYLQTKIYYSYIESQTSEQAARMVAMQSAGKNAMDMIDRLTLDFNKARQAGITKEILEVVGTAEALK